ncbi:molecular chaperone TorD [Cardiobacteriaceae bacterium TAE3-ERU3]|nr:molecular chaperone TorD [Cardiobacteriaceae bacterium TAE3-ERU3]
MNTNEQWQAANTARAALYRWFAELFAHELTPATLDQWQHGNAYTSIHEAFSSLGLEEESQRVQNAINDLEQLPESERALELAADFAQLFLLSGRDSAPPYASYYLEDDQRLYGKPADDMRRFLDQHQLTLHPNFREPDDHISVYLIVMSLWIGNKEQDAATNVHEQAEFLDNALLPWLADFSDRCQTIRSQNDFYPAITSLATQFIRCDRAILDDISVSG